MKKQKLLVFIAFVFLFSIPTVHAQAIEPGGLDVVVGYITQLGQIVMDFITPFYADIVSVDPLYIGVGVIALALMVLIMLLK